MAAPATVALMTLAGVLGSACGGTTSANGPVIDMFDNRFAPDVLEVLAGTTVEFPNEGRVNHNVVDADGAFDSREPGGEDQRPGESWSHTFSEPGTYSIYCSLHAVRNNQGEWEGMVATITVTPPPVEGG